jgi:superfamily II DNA/RNA helicase
VDWLTEKMRDADLTIHGDMPQQERESIMSEFRLGDDDDAAETQGRSVGFGRKGEAINFVENVELLSF